MSGLLSSRQYICKKGRSTNCLINQVGIYVHKKEQGYSNYAFPYSWDVRMGHKTREASLDEINEEIDENEDEIFNTEVNNNEIPPNNSVPTRDIKQFQNSDPIDQKSINIKSIKMIRNLNEIENLDGLLKAFSL